MNVFGYLLLGLSGSLLLGVYNQSKKRFARRSPQQWEHEYDEMINKWHGGQEKNNFEKIIKSIERDKSTGLLIMAIGEVFLVITCFGLTYILYIGQAPAIGTMFVIITFAVLQITAVRMFQWGTQRASQFISITNQRKAQAEMEPRE